MKISWTRTEDKNYTSEAGVLFPAIIHRSSTPPSNTPTPHPLTSLLTPHSPSDWSPRLHLLPASAPGARHPSHHPSPPSGLSCYDSLFLSSFITQECLRHCGAFCIMIFLAWLLFYFNIIFLYSCCQNSLIIAYFLPLFICAAFTRLQQVLRPVNRPLDA